MSCHHSTNRLAIDISEIPTRTAIRLAIGAALFWLPGTACDRAGPFTPHCNRTVHWPEAGKEGFAADDAVWLRSRSGSSKTLSSASISELGSTSITPLSDAPISPKVRQVSLLSSCLMTFLGQSYPQGIAVDRADATHSRRLHCRAMLLTGSRVAWNVVTPSSDLSARDAGEALEAADLPFKMPRSGGRLSLFLTRSVSRGSNLLAGSSSRRLSFPLPQEALR